MLSLQGSQDSKSNLKIPIDVERTRVTDTFIRGFKEADFVKTMDFVDEAVEIAKAVQVLKSQFSSTSYYISLSL